MTEETKLLPCPFCGGDHIVLWSGFGTQADVICEECCCERNVQVVDLFEIDERPKMDLETCRFPDAAIERVNQHLISEWNTRARSTPEPTEAQPVAWQKFIHGRWCNLPEDWAATENMPGHTYRPLFVAPPLRDHAAAAPEMHSAVRAWLTCPASKRPSAEALGARIAAIASAMLAEDAISEGKK